MGKHLYIHIMFYIFFIGRFQKPSLNKAYWNNHPSSIGPNRANCIRNNSKLWTWQPGSHFWHGDLHTALSTSRWILTKGFWNGHLFNIGVKIHKNSWLHGLVLPTFRARHFYRFAMKFCNTYGRDRFLCRKLIYSTLQSKLLSVVGAFSCQEKWSIRHLHIFHNTPCSLPTILAWVLSQFLLEPL